MVDLAGGGLAESIAETNQSLNREHVDLGEVVLNYAAISLDALGVIANPVDTLATTAIGFIIEHLKPLRDVLDWTTGDPDGVRSAVERWNTVAADLHDVGVDHGKTPDLAPTWLSGASQSAASCGEVMKFRTDQIHGASMACIALADVTAHSGTLVAAARGVIRDIIASYVWDLLKKAAVKLPLGLLTAGASAATFVAEAMYDLAKAIRRINHVLGKLLDRLQQSARHLQTIARKLDESIGLMTRTKGNVWFPKDTLVPSTTGVPLKGLLDHNREERKAEATERESAQEDAEQVDELHEQHDHGVNGSLRTDAAEDPEQIEQSPPAQGETEDWWTRRGTLY